MTPISTRLREVEENLRGDEYLYGISEQDFDTHSNVMQKHFTELASIRADVDALADEMRKEAQMRMECENTAPDEYAYLHHMAAKLSEGK